MFYLHIEILCREYLVLTTDFCKLLLHRHTFARPSRDHHVIIKLSGITICFKFAMVIADSLMITRWSRYGRAKVCRWVYDVNVCKNQQWAPNNRGIQFQHVGRRTTFLKSKMLLFPYTFDFFLPSYNPFFTN